MSGMKRLIVRLSVVGFVLAIGAAVIAHSVLTRRAAPAPPAAAPDAASEGQLVTEPPVPIRGDDTATPSPVATLQPPPASAFTRSNGLRTVSHDDANPTLEPPVGHAVRSSFPGGVDPAVPESDRDRASERDGADEGEQDADDRGAGRGTDSLIPADPWARGGSYGSLSPPSAEPVAAGRAEEPARAAPDAYSRSYSDRQPAGGSIPMAAASNERDVADEGEDLAPVHSASLGAASDSPPSPARLCPARRGSWRRFSIEPGRPADAASWWWRGERRGNRPLRAGA